MGAGQERFHRQLERLGLLVLDELGYVPCSKAGAELLFEVVSRAYEPTSMIVTTNLPFESWTEIMGSERLTGALLDRLTHRIHIVEANGELHAVRRGQFIREDRVSMQVHPPGHPQTGRPQCGFWPQPPNLFPSISK